MAGIFNSNIFNNSIFNTGVSTTGHSGYFRIWLADIQSTMLKKWDKEKKAATPVEAKVTPHPVKVNKDGSVTILPFAKPKRKKEPAYEQTRPDHLPLKPMYREPVPVLPDHRAEVVQITSTLSEMVAGFQPTVARMKKTKAENDEDEDVLFLLMAA